MTTPNEQVVIDFWKAFDRLDLDAALDFLTDDCVHDDKPIRVNTGKAEIRAFFAPQIEGLRSCRAELKETLAVGDMVGNSLLINDIRSDEIEFIYRGVVLARRF